MEKYRNIYQAARELKGLTQEAASERLYISVESLRAYETDRRRPPDQIVVDMAMLYDFPYLSYQHMSRGAFGGILPEVQPLQIQQAAIRLFGLLRRFAAQHRTEQLREIAEDGKIDDTERPEYDAIMDELRQIIECALSIDLAS